MLKTCGFGKKLPQLATLIDQNWSGVWSKWCNIVKYILIYQSNNNLKSITQPRHLHDLLAECHIEMYNRFSRLKIYLDFNANDSSNENSSCRNMEISTFFKAYLHILKNLEHSAQYIKKHEIVISQKDGKWWTLFVYK